MAYLDQHGASTLMSLIKNRKVDASKIDGVIDISHIPAASLAATAADHEVTLIENRLKNPDLDGPGSYIGRRVEGGGIIFFDYAIGFKGGIGDGLGGLLSISPKSGLFNKYHVNSAGVVVKDIDYGNDRFYVVQDRDWWNVNTGGPLAWALDSTTTPTLNTNLGTSREFGTGRDNTGKCIKAFMTDQEKISDHANTYRLVWRAINPSDGTWFVPSIEELQVFMFMSIPNAIRKSYNESTQLTQLPMNYYFGYWSSSENAASDAWRAYFGRGLVYSDPKSVQHCVRVQLVRTF